MHSGFMGISESKKRCVSRHTTAQHNSEKSSGPFEREKISICFERPELGETVS
jgi:hypothetical protein